MHTLKSLNTYYGLQTYLLEILFPLTIGLLLFVSRSLARLFLSFCVVWLEFCCYLLVFSAYGLFRGQGVR